MIASAMQQAKLKSPFPYFGGKSRIAAQVWERFGDVRNYVEPFAGSLAVLLSRPHYPFVERRIETVNDLDCFLANFWRAMQADDQAVAEHCDWPVNEADLHARHYWLVNVGRGVVERLRTDPDFYDAKIAGWWVWGICQWIGSGWCHHPEWQQLPHLGDAGRGVHRPTQQLPHLGNANGQGITVYGDDLRDYLHAIAERIRRVRVCCGDWRRVLGETPTTKQGTTAVFLDPPYTEKATRKSGLYACDSESIGHDVMQWAVENGGNPQLKIAVCGYDGEYDFPASWDRVAWKSSGGYGSQGDDDNAAGRANAKREVVWFSPACVNVRRVKQVSLFQ